MNRIPYPKSVRTNVSAGLLNGFNFVGRLSFRELIRPTYLKVQSEINYQ